MEIKQANFYYSALLIVITILTFTSCNSYNICNGYYNNNTYSLTGLSSEEDSTKNYIDEVGNKDEMYYEHEYMFYFIGDLCITRERMDEIMNFFSENLNHELSAMLDAYSTLYDFNLE